MTEDVLESLVIQIESRLEQYNYGEILLSTVIQENGSWITALPDQIRGDDVQIKICTCNEGLKQVPGIYDLTKVFWATKNPPQEGQSLEDYLAPCLCS